MCDVWFNIKGSGRIKRPKVMAKHSPQEISWFEILKFTVLMSEFSAHNQSNH